MALQKQVITAGEANRSYLVAEPPPGAPVSAVIMSLHGTRSTAARQARLSGFGQLPRTASAVVVFPQAIEPIGTGYEWDPGQDVDYIAGLATKLLSQYRTPQGRVLLTGMSGGARMSSLFASVHPELVQAVGAVAGLRSPGVPVHRPVPVLSFHGTNDKINPYGGSGTQRWRKELLYPERALALRSGPGDGAPPDRRRSCGHSGLGGGRCARGLDLGQDRPPGNAARVMQRVPRGSSAAGRVSQCGG